MREPLQWCGPQRGHHVLSNSLVSVVWLCCFCMGPNVLCIINNMAVSAIYLALIARISGMNCTRHSWVLFGPVTSVIDTKISQAVTLLLIIYWTVQVEDKLFQTLCHSLLTVALCSCFMSVNCRHELFVAIILRRCLWAISTRLYFLQSYSTSLLAITALHTFQPIRVLVQFLALFMVQVHIVIQN